MNLITTTSLVDLFPAVTIGLIIAIIAAWLLLKWPRDR